MPTSRPSSPVSPTPALPWTWPELLLWPLGACLAAAAWVALLLAWTGRFAAAPALTAGALAASLVVWRAWRGGALRVAALRADRWGAATLLLALGLTGLQAPAGAAWPAALDAGWYLDSAAWIQRSRALAFRPAAIEALPEALRANFVSSFDDQAAVLDPGGRRFPTSRVLGLLSVNLAVDSPAVLPAHPYHPPLLASALALGIELRGAARAGDLALVFGFLWLLAVAVAARRLGYGVLRGDGALQGDGPSPLLAVGVAGCGPAFAYYAGQPFAELAASAALLAGLSLLPGTGATAERGRILAAGLCLGLAGLIKVDALPPVGLALILGAWPLRERPPLIGYLAAGALPGLGSLALLLAGPGLTYARLNGGGVLKLAGGAGRVGLGVAFALALLALALRWRHRLPRRSGAWAALLIAGLALAQAQLWLPATDQQRPGMLAIGLWLLTPLGFWLAVMGLVEGPRKDGVEGPRGSLLVLALASAFTLAAPLVSLGLSPLYAGRRLLIAALPLAAILAGQVLARPWGPAGPRSARALSLGGILLLLVSLSLAASPFRGARGRDLSGGLGLIRQLAASTPSDAVLVFPSVLDGRHAGRLASALEALEGRAGAVLGRPKVAGAALADAFAAWRAAGRPIYWVADDGQELPELPGWRFVQERDLDIVTRHLAPRPVLPPEMASLPLTLDLYRVERGEEPAP